MRALDNTDIDKYFKGNRRYGGTFSKDKLPTKMGSKAYIINMQDSDKGGGTHWVAAWNLNGETVYFDSFGEQNAPQSIEKFMKTSSVKKITRNPHDLQSMVTSSCGEWSIYMIAHAMQGKKLKEILKQFTSNKVVNEHLLHLYFGREAFTDKTLKKSFKKSKMSAKGIRDVFNYMKRKFNNAVDTVKQIASGPRQFGSPAVRRFLEEHGNVNIYAMKLCRRPIPGIVERVANVLSFGRYEKNKDGLDYDKMFHLYLLLQLKDGTIVRLEKSHVVGIQKSDWDQDKSECIPILVDPTNTTLNSLMANAEKLVGVKQIFVYDSVNANCQCFCRDILKASGLLNDTNNFFCMQDAKGVMKHLGYLEVAAKQATNAAHLGDIVMHGKGFDPRNGGDPTQGFYDAFKNLPKGGGLREITHGGKTYRL